MKTPVSGAAATEGGRAARQLAAQVELIYSSDRQPGISRHRAGRGFTYRGPDDAPVRDGETLARIRKLAIPPAYRDVWICVDSRGHLQATGRDDRARKQYRYHERWQSLRSEAKFARLLAFGRSLPRLRERVEADLRGRTLNQRWVAALAVKLLDTTFIRVGNQRYATENRAYGLTTLRARHMREVHGELRLKFRGKGGKARDLLLDDKRLCRLIKRCQELPGQRLLQFLDDDGRPQPLDSDHVNDYLHEVLGERFTAKDFRTWAGTVIALGALVRAPRPDSERSRRQVVTDALREVASYLGNTPAVCRKSYVHPDVLQAYHDGVLARLRLPADAQWAQLEAATLRFLKQHATPAERNLSSLIQRQAADDAAAA